jgi:O-antigen/teichoic acid export membrane protein
MATGAAWMIVLRLADRGFGLVSTLILARLLLPDDFGILAIAMSALALLEVLTMLGLDVALISRRDTTREHFDTAWTIGIVAAAVVALALVGLATPASVFFSDTRLAPVIAFLAIGAFVQGFENIGVVNFRKELLFHKEFVFQVAKRLIMMGISIPLAIVLRNYWALVIGAVGGRVAWVVLSFFAHPYRPQLTLRRSREVLGFSAWLMVNSILYYFKEQTASLVLGRLANPRAVGLYALSYDIASLPTAQLTAPINRAVLPGLAKLSNQSSDLANAVISVFGFTAALALPAGLGIAAIAPALVPLALGSNWLEAVPVIQLLAIASSFAALLSSSYTAFLALQAPRMPALIDMGYVVLQLGLMLILCGMFGAPGAAGAALATVAVIVPVNYTVLLRRMRLPLQSVFSALWRPSLGTLIMWIAVSAIVETMPRNAIAEMVVVVAFAVPAGVTIYTGALAALWILAGRPEGAERTALAWIGPHLPRSWRTLVERLQQPK